jgi:hypothetical protein
LCWNLTDFFELQSKQAGTMLKVSFWEIKLNGTTWSIH